MSETGRENPENPKSCVDCGGKDGVTMESGNIIPDGKTVPVCRGCKKDRVVYYQTNEVPKPLPKKPDSPNQRCC